MEEKNKKIEDVESVVISSTVLADIFGLTTRRIRMLAEEGIIRKTSRGRYNLQENIKKYIVYLKTSQNLKENIVDDDGLDPDKERALLTRRQREKLDIEIAAMRGSMHLSNDVERVMNDMLANFKAKLISIPTKVAPILIARNDISEIQELLQKEFFEVLQEFSDYNPALFYNEKYIELDEDDLVGSEEAIEKEKDTKDTE
ncbi:MAG: phage terminase Nu1 subunit (DNA packaging protein) [Clostridium sp.]|jgi:phage terminase Nu1 subunit (DNA packaging protein)